MKKNTIDFEYEIIGFDLNGYQLFFLEEKLKKLKIKSIKITKEDNDFLFECNYFGNQIIMKNTDFFVLIQLVKIKISILFSRLNKQKKQMKKYKFPQENNFFDDEFDTKIE